MDSPWRRGFLHKLLFVAPAVAAIGSATAWAQVAPFGGRPVAGSNAKGKVDLAEYVFKPAQRRSLRDMAKARALIEQGRYSEAIRYFRKILDAPEDHFFQPDRLKTPQVHRSLKGEVQRLIARMPPAGRKQYEEDCGIEARRLLDEAIAAGDTERLAQVARRFFHTRSGYEATLLLGYSHLDDAEPLAAALTFERLRGVARSGAAFEPTLSLATAAAWLQAGMPEKAEQVLLALRTRHQDSSVEIAGEQVELFQKNSEALTWLIGLTGLHHMPLPRLADDWAMFRGNAARNAVAAGGVLLLNRRWRIPTSDDSWDLERPSMVKCLLEQERLRRAQRDGGSPAITSLHPLAVDDVVMMRTWRNLLAVDLVTGRRLWNVDVADPARVFAGEKDSQSSSRYAPQLAALLGYRMWDDATYGTLSSDGGRVFSIEYPSLGIGGPSKYPVIINGRTVYKAHKSYNHLAAHDIHTGEFAWRMGGPADTSTLPQAGTFFLGPPLPLTGRLYVLGETKGEIRLFALRADSGEVIWYQQVAMAEQDITADAVRRLAGASPSYGDGILVCPTSTGAVVAVDLASRSLLWGYRYERRQDGRRPMIGLVVRGPNANVAKQRRWLDASATVADGCVLVSPVESDQLHCLDLIDGTLLWKQPRDDGLYLACVHGGKVVVVGRRGVRAWRLAEADDNSKPKSAWDGRTVKLPEGAVPSGRGFLSGNEYFLPLSTAEVATIDVTAGQITHVTRSRKGIVPGNLVCYKGRAISQGLDGVEMFDQLEAARREADRRLAARADDPEALCLRAEILLDEGKLSEAIAFLRQAYDSNDPDGLPRRRALLRDALMDGLKRQFAVYRDRAVEIESLLDDSDGRAEYLRLMAGGFQESGEWRTALKYYLKLVDLEPGSPPLDVVDKTYSVRRDRWIQARLASLREEAGNSQASLDAPIETRLKAAVASESIDALQWFLSYFGNHPSAAEARRELTQRLIENNRLLEAEMLLWPDWESPDASIAAKATTKLAEVLVQTKRSANAAACYRRLWDEFSDVVCSGDKTGRELLDALPDDHPGWAFLRRGDPWRVGTVKHKARSSRISRADMHGLFLPVRGNRNVFFQEMSLEYDRHHHDVIGYDMLGRRQWRVSVAESGSRRSAPYYANCRARGHLLLVSTGYDIIALDALGSSGSAAPTRLWRHDLTDLSADTPGAGRFPIPLANNPWAVQRLHLSGYRNTVDVLGPVTTRYVCFQRYRNVVAVDSLSGQTLWIRRNVAPGSRLFGDDRFLCVIAPNADEAMVYRALDGELLGRRKVPRWRQHVAPHHGWIQHVTPSRSGQSCLATLGSRLLLWNNKGGKPTLKLFDVWQQRDVWVPHTFAAGAKACLIGNEAIGVLQMDGRLELLSLHDGRTVFEIRLEPEENLLEFFILPSSDGYAVVTHVRPKPNQANHSRINPISATLSRPIQAGRAYMLDHHGRPTWPSPVDISNQCLLLNQPSRLPLLTFACHKHRRGASQLQVSILCIDKRTGQIVYQGTSPANTTVLRIVGDPKKQAIGLTMNRRTVTLTLADDSGAAPSPAEALLKALRKVLE